jgi:hypothetical protein
MDHIVGEISVLLVGFLHLLRGAIPINETATVQFYQNLSYNDTIEMILRMMPNGLINKLILYFNSNRKQCFTELFVENSFRAGFSKWFITCSTTNNIFILFNQEL